MQVIIHSWHTEIFLTDEEAKELCKPGAGADTCSWLVMASTGWECMFFNRPHSISSRRVNGTMVAMRDGCDTVSNFDPGGKGIGEISF